MKRYIKSFYIVLISFFSGILIVNANSINRIDMDVYIAPDGNATVSEVWDAEIDSGTEFYKLFTEMGNSSITNFSVSDDSGRLYEDLFFWNTNANFEQKAYKSGKNIVDNGIELCWGISEYGHRYYNIKYNIINFVTQYSDVQGIYTNLLNVNQDVGNVTITIHSDMPFSLHNTRIWSFGNYGQINFSEGNIVFKSNGIFHSKDYIVVLVRFQESIFSTKNKSSMSFDDIYKSAFSTVDKEELPRKKLNEKYPGIEGLFFLLGITALLPLLLLVSSFIPSGVVYKFENNAKKPRKKEITYWRDIPCGGNLEIAYWLCSKSSTSISESKLRKGLIGAILLKWIKDGKIKIIRSGKSGNDMFNHNNSYAIDFSNFNSTDNQLEQSLLNIFLKASGKNKILESRNFSKWCKKNYFIIFDWFSKINGEVERNFEKKGLISSYTIGKKRLIGAHKYNIITEKTISSELRDEAIRLFGLKKFLLNFSNISEKQYIDVHIWEDYLLFSELFGIARKVSNQFNKLYPGFNFDDKIDVYSISATSAVFASICYNNIRIGERKYKKLYEAHNSSGIDYSGTSTISGGGGSSFHSGGTSAGGSSGGGIR